MRPPVCRIKSLRRRGPRQDPGEENNRVDRRSPENAGQDEKLKSPGAAAPSIDWDLTLTLDTSGPEPKYELTGKWDGYPAMEIYVNRQPIIGTREKISRRRWGT